LIHGGIRGVELHGDWRIGVENDAFDRIPRWSARVTGDLNIPEAMIGEVRLKNFVTAPLQGVGIGHLSGAHVVGIELTVRQENR
jgi:hypothetical protein